jgi:uncharacterized delta-60 repeat protein
MKQTFILLSFFFFQTISHAQFTGALDATFGANGKVTTSFDRGDDVANAVLVQPDGKIVAAGHSSKVVSGYHQMSLARYNKDGTLDNSFGTNGKVITPFATYSVINAITQQTDGKIIAVGVAVDSSNERNFAVVRYNPNGSLDANFGENGRLITHFSGVSTATVVTIQVDGKIVVAGYRGYDNSTKVDGVIAVARYSNLGQLDTTFNATGKVETDINPNYNDISTSIALQTDNKIVICGKGTDYEDGCFPSFPPDLFVVRYNANGSLDNSFAINGKFIQKESEGSTVKILNTGKILVAGNTNGWTYNFLLTRLNTNGTIDATFNFDAPTRGQSTDMVVQSDNKIIIAGKEYKDSTMNFDFKLVRCNSEGVLDNTFGTNGKIITPPVLLFERYSKIALQADGKLVACGSSKNYGQYNFNLMRYNNALVSTGTGQLTADKNAYFVYPNPTNNALTIDVKALNASDIDVKLVDMQGRVVLQKNYSKVAANASLNIDIQYFTAGLYVLQLTSAETKWAQLISKY